MIGPRWVAAAGLALALATRTSGETGFPTLASAAWVVAGAAWQRGDGIAVAHAAAAAGRLDPRWSVPWVYGALMARELGAAAEAEALLAEGATVRPDDPTLPAMLGALRWADHRDADGAADWYRRAAAIPGASPDLADIARALGDR